MRQKRSLVAALTAVGLIAGLVVPVAVVMSAASAESGTVSGQVFLDFDSDGIRDTTVAPGVATDQALGGIEVRAFDGSGELAGTATTGTDGTYSLAVSGSTPEVRVEFVPPATGPDAGLEPSFDATTGSPAAGRSGSLVQFVTIGATNVNLGMLHPEEYCQANPNIAASRLCAGSGIPNAPTVLVTNYDGGPYTTAQGFSNLYSSWPATSAGTRSNTGSILGMTWDPASKRIFNSAYIRRMSEMFEQGGKPLPGALFVTSPNGTTEEEGTGGSTNFLVDLEALAAGDQFSNSNPAGPGFIPTNAARKIQYAINGTIDGGAENDGVDSDIVAGQDGVHEEVGKAGIGDIETDGSGRLWVVSLYDRNLYEVPLPADGSAPTAVTSVGDITNGVSCTNGTGRPFSVTHWRGSLYLGVVCDGSSDFNSGNPTAVTDANLSFTVRRYDLTTQSWSTFLGPQSLAGVAKGQADGSSNSLATARKWNAWTDAWINSSNPQVFGTRPVPMLSDIQFDGDGSMILGFRDRTGDQNALNEQETPSGAAHAYPTLASGDIYRVCRTGTGYTSADYAFEGTSAGCTQKTNATNGTEYYAGDKYFNFHYETGVGMLEQVPGFPEVLMNAYDPYDGDGSGTTFYSGGTRYLRNATGVSDGAFPNAGGGTIFYAFSGQAGNPNTEGGFLKVNGMSDVEALCDSAPLQIGNRVWMDLNENGVQDPGEDPVVGATVRLYDGEGALVGTAVTDADGRYLFASNVDEASDGGAAADWVGGGLAPNQEFTIRLDLAADYEPGGPLQGFELASTDSSPGDVTTTGYDLIDNDASAVGSGSVLGVNLFPQITVSARTAGENSDSFDFGLVSIPVAVGDYVWFDVNGNGRQDAGEEPVEGVTVTLFAADGVTPATDVDGNAATAVTDGNGYYVIDALLPGDYVAVFKLPDRLDGWAFTSQVPGDDLLDSNPNPGTGKTPIFTIAPSATGNTVADVDGETLAEFVNPTIDAGIVPLVGVGDYTWVDHDRDGVQDAGEPPLRGVTVTLYKADGVTPATNVDGLPATAVTDSNGYYLIDALLPGNYVAVFDLPDGYIFTTAGSVSGTGATDSNADPVTGKTAVFTIAPEASGSTLADTNPATRAVFVNPTIDAGVVPLVGIGDYTWFDRNGDGVQDPGEPPLQGVTVTLFKADGVTPATDVDGNPATAVTAANGFYFIDSLLPGDYVARFELPEDREGWVFTTQLSGELATDSNPDRLTGVTPVFTIAPKVAGQTMVDVNSATSAVFANLTIDAGVVPLVAMGDFTWYDLDRDGQQDADEPVLPGVTVTLYGPNGATPVTDVDGNPATAVTDENGYYFIDALLPGDYVAVFELPENLEGWVFTTQQRGTSTQDSNPAPFTGVTPVFTIAPGVAGDTVADDDLSTRAVFVNPTIDAGVVPIVAVGDFLWIDRNSNGLQDPDEPPLQGVTVTLFGADGVTPATDVDGNPATAVTDENGFYLIDSLLPGSFVAVFELPEDFEGWVFTTQQTGDVASDSNPDRLTGRTPVFTVAPQVAGQTVADTDAATRAVLVNPTIDAGAVPLVAMGDFTWYDLDLDGQQDPDEPVLPGVTVTLFLADGVTPATDVDGNPATAVTDGSGYYFIDALLPGDYVAVFELPEDLEGWVFTTQQTGDAVSDSNPDRLTGRTPVFTIAPDEAGETVADVNPTTRAVFVNPTIDAGIVPLVAMGDVTWYDLNVDGLQDADEPVLAGVTVTLFLADGVTPATDVDGNPATAVTDENGFYFIDALLPGDYVAQFQLPENLEGWSFTRQASGDGALDSNPDRLSGVTPVFTIAPVVTGDTTADEDPATMALFVNPTIDAGVVPIVAVGDFTWIDVNRDGVQDPDEPVLEGVTVTLFLADGVTPATDVDGNPATAVTDANGYYFIDALFPGDYVATFQLPPGYVFTTQQGELGTSGTDSNPDPATGTTPVFTIGFGAEGDTIADSNPATRAVFVNPTIDAGVIPLVGVGDVVWVDANRNGMQDPGETPLADVPVELLGADGTPAVDAAGNPATSVTDAEGFYFIDGLLPGDYTMRFTIPGTYFFTDSLAGDQQMDSNPAVTDDPLVGVTPMFTLMPFAEGQMVANTDEVRLAAFVDPTIDAGVVLFTPGSAPPGSSGRLPSTGLGTGGLLLLALGLLALGATMVVAVRRRSAMTLAAISVRSPRGS